MRRIMVNNLEERRRAMTRRLWMDFFNRTLRDQGVISKHEYQRMENAIRLQYPMPEGKQRKE